MKRRTPPAIAAADLVEIPAKDLRRILRNLHQVARAITQELDRIDGATSCRRCGCTEAHACEGGCAWMPDLVDVCTACATPKELRALRRRIA